MGSIYDVIIIGSGPAGLAAAIYMARAKYRTLILEREQIGGQIALTADVENYPGILQTSGIALADTMRQQAAQFGAEFLTANVTALSLNGLLKMVATDQGNFQSFGILIATGSTPRSAGFSGESAFRGRGISYCATCDGAFFSGKDVFVIGGGYSAAQEALFLTKYASSVTICIRRDRFSCARSMAERVLAHPKIQVNYHTEITEVGGDHLLRYAKLKNKETGVIETYRPKDGDTFGVFIFIGHTPETALFAQQLKLSENGYLVTDATQKTSCTGVYGAGDICEKTLRQIVTAVSDGAVAATSLEKYISEIHDRYHIPFFSMPNENKTPKEDKAIHPPAAKTNHNLIPQSVQEQLKKLFRHLNTTISFRLYHTKSALSKKAAAFLDELCTLSPQLKWTSEAHLPTETNSCPIIEFCHEDGKSYNIFFHGIPGGHELESFAMTIYNAAGKGLPLAASLQQDIQHLPKQHLQVAVTLSCTMCPETVIAACRFSLLQPKIRTDIFVLQWHPELQKKYHIMSVPCVIQNGAVLGFGKMTTAALLEKLTAPTRRNL